MSDPAGNGTFRAVGTGKRRMHGRPALLAGGLPPESHDRLLAALASAGLAHIPVVFVTGAAADTSLAGLTALPGGTGRGEASTTASCMVMSGLQEDELHALMRVCREAGLAPQTWACVTPTSESWTARRLFAELAREREALKQAAARNPAKQVE